MAKRPVLIELSQTQVKEEATTFESTATTFKTILSTVTAAPELPGFELDTSYPGVVVPPRAPAEGMGLTLEATEEAPESTILVRGFIDDAAVESAMAAVTMAPG